MHKAGYHGLSDAFGGSNEPRSEHTPHFDNFRVLYHTVFWVIRIPTSKMPNVFVDVRQDLFYAYDWPSQLVRPIWRVKRAPKRAYASFQRFSCAIAHHFLVIEIPKLKMPNVFVDVRQDLVYAYGWPSRLVRPICRVKGATKRAYA